MKAVIMEPDRSVHLVQRPRPVPGDDQVLIKVAACGICGSDLHVHNGMPSTWAFPMIVGHELSGTIVECGKKVHTLSVGQNVTIQPLVSCGKCELCMEGRTNICENVQLIGGELDGGCAEYIAVSEKNVIPLPEAMPVHHGALAEPAACCVHAVRRLGGRHYRRAVLIGAGTIGLLTLAVVREFVDTIVVSDTMQSRLDTALALGASHCIRADREDTVSKALELSGGAKYDLVIEAVGISATREQVFKLMRPGADCLLLGWGEQYTAVDFNYLICQECAFYGSQCHTRYDFEDALRLIMNKTINYDKLVLRLPIEEAERAYDNAQAAVKIHLIP